MIDTPNYRETEDGEIVPLYEGVNGPVTPAGADMAEVEAFLDPSAQDEPAPEVPAEFMPVNSIEHIMWRAEQRAKEAAQRVIGSEVVATVGSDASDRAAILAEERIADRAGTHPGTSGEQLTRLRGGNESSSRYRRAIRSIQMIRPDSTDPANQAELREAQRFLRSIDRNPDDFVPEAWRA